MSGLDWEDDDCLTCSAAGKHAGDRWLLSGDRLLLAHHGAGVAVAAGEALTVEVF